MEDSCEENVLTEIEKNMKNFVDEDVTDQLDENEFLEEYDVVDSWEVDGGEEVHSEDERYRKSGRRSGGSSYTRRTNDKFSERGNFHDSYRRLRNSHKRVYSRDNSKQFDHRRLPRRSRDVRTSDRNSVEHLREPTSGSSQNLGKLPDLKCTTSLATGEVDVVLLNEDKIPLDAFDEKDSHKKHTLLYKNPFADLRLKGKRFHSSDKSRFKDKVLSPRYKTEKNRRESRVVDARKLRRSSSPYRTRSRHRDNPRFCDRKSPSKSVSTFDEVNLSCTIYEPKPCGSGRWYSRSREGSFLSSVSSKSSLSIISSDEMSPGDHVRKQSPLWPRGYVHRPKSKNHGNKINDANFMSNSEDFDYKLSLLLKEGKQKQSFANDSSECTSSGYHSSTRRPAEWTNSRNLPMYNYSYDTTWKPDYDTNRLGSTHSGFNQDNANQVYPIGGDQLNYVGVEPPLMSVQECMQSNGPQVQHGDEISDWSNYNRKRVPSQTHIPRTDEENVTDEEDPMRTPSPPVISGIWREIKSGEKKLSSLLDEAKKKCEVIARCKYALQKMQSNDHVMEQFKMQCEKIQHFSVIENPNQTSGLKPQSFLAQGMVKQFQSPLKRKGNNPCLKYVPWLPGDGDHSKADDATSREDYLQSNDQHP
ncbi:uncharacterized protein [Hetaerina americana]|uniref:uncharacterized protein n=1 Tax=Hetaerina americana TaxID=62018 RepID=UPI003A7F2E09